MLLFLLPLFGAIKSESYPAKLSDEEEKMYLDLFLNKQDENARAKLIEHNLRLVAHIVKKYENTDYDKDDLLSIGIIGLIKAVDSYQGSYSNKLATYAARCIENEILMHLRSNKNKNNLIHLQRPCAVDKDGNEVELLDLLEDKNIDIMASYEKKAKYKELNDALKTLNSREFDIISRRYGINQEAQTQKQIAKELNISRSYVSRIEKRALLKLYFLLKK